MGEGKEIKEILERLLSDINSVCWLFIFFIIALEITFAYLNIFVGVIMYLLLLISLLIISCLRCYESSQPLYLALTLIPIIRVISISIPLAGIPTIIGFMVVSVPLFIAGVMVARMIGLTITELGFTFDKLYKQLLISLLGLPLGFINFLIIKPVCMNITVTSKEILIWVVVSTICIGLLEEFIFRGILFNVALKVIGSKDAIYFISLLYAALNISGKSFLNVIYPFLISILFCRLFVMEKSILGLSLAHGLINIVVYVISPLAF